MLGAYICTLCKFWRLWGSQRWQTSFKLIRGIGETQTIPNNLPIKVIGTSPVHIWVEKFALPYSGWPPIWEDGGAVTLILHLNKIIFLTQVGGLLSGRKLAHRLFVFRWQFENFGFWLNDADDLLLWFHLVVLVDGSIPISSHFDEHEASLILGLFKFPLPF